MLARVVTLRFDPLLEAFDDGPLQEFLKAREVFAIHDHFFVRNEMPCLAVPVTYGPRPRAASWRALVPDEDLPFFTALREWRWGRAQRSGPIRQGELPARQRAFWQRLQTLWRGARWGASMPTKGQSSQRRLQQRTLWVCGTGMALWRQ